MTNKADRIGPGNGLMVNNLVHLEQCVNERFGSDPPPQLPRELLPEAGEWRPLAWARVARHEVQFLSDNEATKNRLVQSVDGGDGTVLFPVHPLVEKYYPESSLVRFGKFAVSASYRTVFFEPTPDGPLASLVPEAHITMIKLHLDDPLPGIAGDRRLTPEKVRKCVDLSAILPELLSRYGDQPSPMVVLRERFAVLHGNRGAIIRFVPRNGLVPLFAFYSRDSENYAAPPLVEAAIREFGWSADEVAMRLADWFAKPILSAVLAGFRQGFALEMHGQNTLIEIMPNGRINGVYFRDLESVVFFPEIRAWNGLAPLELDQLGIELFQNPRRPTRWFNRNVDHDVGRIFKYTLWVLERDGVIRKHHAKVVTRHIRRIARQLITSYGLDKIARQGRWLPFSRSPYGDGSRRGHYYRTMYR